MPDDLLYKIGITLIPSIGSVNGKKQVSYCGGAEAVFRESRKALLKIPGIGESTVNNIVNHSVLSRAEKEISFIKKYNIKPLFYTDEEYPRRLFHCDDGPVMLYYQGNQSLNYKRMLAVVGTRRSTPYGRTQCEKIIEGLKNKGVMIVSGLAYGIDSCAHKNALSYHLPTVGVLGHGLDRLYPAENRNLAASMMENGGLLTEYLSGTSPDRENFPKRNRIVAGMTDATLVVESRIKGGAIITADIAFSYSRDVFAVPGRTEDVYSKGTNFLIKTNRAALVESADDIIRLTGWEDDDEKPVSQPELFVNLSDDEKILMDILTEDGETGIDELMAKSKIPVSQVSSLLLNLEFRGLVISLPGKRYKLR
jgi:DNA processing protein